MPPSLMMWISSDTDPRDGHCRGYRYVPNGSFTSHSDKLNENPVRRDLQFTVFIQDYRV